MSTINKYMDYTELLEFYKDKKVFITGHTGFKGSWLSQILLKAGASVTGYSLPPATTPALFDIAGIEKREGMNSITGDIRDYDSLFSAIEKAQPDIVLHLAAQPLVIDSYKAPRYTYETNVMGTVNILEAIRQIAAGGALHIKSVLNVTTDKVYYNNESGNGFTEDMPLDGYDPYSNSKSCSELVTHSYRSSFFNEMDIPVSTARAGNVIGGGDFSENRIIPDCVKAAMGGEIITIRNPYSVRPFQHVIEPLFAYLMIAKYQYEDKSIAGAYNVGPDIKDCVAAGKLADIFCGAWNEGRSDSEKKISWESPAPKEGAFHEAGFLRLDCGKLKDTFGWKPRWSIEDAVRYTVEWSKAYADSDPMEACEIISALMDEQIDRYVKDAG